MLEINFLRDCIFVIALEFNCSGQQEGCARFYFNTRKGNFSFKVMFVSNIGKHFQQPTRAIMIMII